ncbi:fungal-specific transcription factor domain-containing protein [Aspergillus cavernicola]|uniref:Fungal-specific transcription factor domain-containing protein n=1 Tax=Aspergillus cavernicola TaxID=176166 RepID=A0ABR4HWI6_9EURO
MEEDHSQSLPPRRRRPALSCTICRRRKLKCDRGLPCGQCVKSKTPNQCVFSAPKSSQSAVSGSLEARSPSDNRHAPSDAASPVATGLYVFDSKNRVTKPRARSDELQELRTRVQMLEQVLSRSGPIETPEGSGYDMVSEFGLQKVPDPISDQVRNLSERACFRGRNGRTRYRGRSSGELTLSFLDDVVAFLQGRKKDLKSENSEYQKMKKFRFELRSHETKEQDRVSRGNPSSLNEMLPPQNIADELLNLYFSTFETTYRILHIPSFFKEYEAYWAAPEAAGTVFIAKLLTLMAAASCFISPATTVNGKDTLHDVAVGWILSVQSWIASLFVSATAKFDILQIQCLLMIARQALAVDGDVVWNTSGSLIHTAMAMGMHRNPLRFAKMTPFWAEMRRRLWATILELELQASVDVGVPPSIDLDQYDCDPPSNYDDVELTEDMPDGPMGRDSDILTRCSFLITLSRSLPLRVRIAKAANSLKFALSYDDALRLGENLTRLTNEALVPFPSPTSSNGNPSFARSFMLFLMQRSLLILHRPFSLSISLSPKYSYSRKICLESALEMITQFELPLPGFQVARTPCLGHIGGGMFRDECFHAAITVCIELSLQIAESRSNSAPSAHGGSLNDLLRSQQDVLLRVLERSHDNFGSRISPKGNGCKAFFFLSMAVAAVKARLNGEDPLKKIEQAALRAVRVCQHIIRGLPYEELQAQPESDFSDFGPSATHTPAFSSSSISDISFDPISLLSANPMDFSSLDFNNMLDTSYYRVPELWDPDFLAL